MIRSYIITAFRHLLKNRTYSILNALGLSIGLACFTLIGLWVKDELSYDRFHKNADRIYRIAAIFTDESGVMDQAVTPPALGPALMKDFPEVEAAVRIDRNGATVRLDDKQFIEDDILMVDPSFFDVFSFELKRGNKATALSDPYTVVISEKMAKKYFGDADPIGQPLKIFLYDDSGNGADYRVTGIVADCPLNSQFHYNFLGSFSTIDANDPAHSERDSWDNNSYYTYTLLKEGADRNALEAKFPALLEQYVGKLMTQYKFKYEYFLQAYPDIHLRSSLRYEIEPTSSVSYVIIFGTIGIIVLLLACINYVNLSTAYSSDRFKDVGIRKVMGAFKRQLIGQYLMESWLLAMISLVLSFGWVELFRSTFETLTGKEIGTLYTVTSLATLLGITTLVGLLAGLYPSVMLSSFKPVDILKGQLKTGTRGVWLRKSLVVIQYSISMILVIGIVVVQLQMNFIQSKDLGYNKDQLVLLSVNGSQEVMSGYESFTNDLAGSPLVSGVTRSNTSLVNGLGNSTAIAEDATGQKSNATMYRLRIDFDYLDVYGMKLAAGRNFLSDNAADSTKSFLINEAAAKVFGYQNPGDMVGKKFAMSGMQGEVIGVVKDFNYASLQSKIEPMAIYLLRGGFSKISVRLSGDIRSGLDVVLANWKKHFPNSVLDFKFAEDALDRQYRSEVRFSKVFLVFSGISLAIACMGLFALVSYSVASRTREIGIRKVLGASVSGILTMISKEFLLLIAIAAVVAVPVAYYFMSNWLSGFAFRIDLNIFIFVGAAAFVLVIAWLTVTARSLRAASSNPVDSLRRE